MMTAQLQECDVKRTQLALHAAHKASCTPCKRSTSAAAHLVGACCPAACSRRGPAEGRWHVPLHKGIPRGHIVVRHTHCGPLRVLGEVVLDPPATMVGHHCHCTLGQQARAGLGLANSCKLGGPGSSLLLLQTAR